MFKTIKKNWNGAVARWRAQTPVVFKHVIKIMLGISTISVTIHTALEKSGANEPAWWVMVYPYLVGIPVGAAATAQFTQTYNSKGKPIRKRKPKKDGETIINKD